MSGQTQFDLGGCTALVTGGSRGIGHEIAIGLAAAADTAPRDALELLSQKADS